MNIKTEEKVQSLKLYFLLQSKSYRETGKACRFLRDAWWELAHLNIDNLEDKLREWEKSNNPALRSAARMIGREER